MDDAPAGPRPRSFDRALSWVAVLLFPAGLLLPVDYGPGPGAVASGFEFLVSRAADSPAGALGSAAALCLPAAFLLGRRNPPLAAAVAAAALAGLLFGLRREPMAHGVPRLGVPFLFSSALLMTVAWGRAALRCADAPPPE